MWDSSTSGHATGMAGEFFVMEQLFRRGYEATLTLGNAKNIDIVAYRPTDRTKKTKRISVKATTKGGKWTIGRDDLSGEEDMIFVFLRYKEFTDSYIPPEVYIVPAPKAWENALGWLNDTWAIYYSGKNAWRDLSNFKDTWQLI